MNEIFMLSFSREYLKYIIYGIIAVYPALEGWKEVMFQSINTAARKSSVNKQTLKHRDMDYKTANAVLYLLFAITASFYFESTIYQQVLLIFTISFWRWIIYDGVLNLGRNLPFGYSGTTDRSVFDVVLKNFPPVLDLVIKFSLLLIFLTLYIISYV